MEGSDLYKHFDAKVWAHEFVTTVRENPSIATDEECMLSWFASAIMRGYDERYWRSREYKRAVLRALHPWYSPKRYFGSIARETQTA